MIAPVFAPVCEYDDKTHSYYINGRRVPSATQIVAGLGLIDTSRFTAYARDRGKAIHAAIASHIAGSLVLSGLACEHRPFVEAAISFLEISNAKIEVYETPVYNIGLGYAGTPDLVGEFFGDPGLPDWKTGSVDERVVGIQTALYDLALPPARSRRRRMAVQLSKTGKYKLFDLTGRAGSRIDYQRATAAVDLYREFIFKEESK